ncbi:MAG TPA: ATP-binding protein [Chitinophagaceae bacterium]|jgi:two-component system, NtrC family, sensor kinase|nr:ATP-binding protein [Chitinophagaceae bacterium]
MKLVIYVATVLLLALSCPAKGFAQGIDADSLQREIMKSLDRQLGEKGIPKSLFDTSKIPSSSYLPLDFKKLFEGINKEISAAQSAGDIYNMSKGYGKLSTLDSVRGNYKGAYENYKLYAAYRDSLQKKEFEKKELQAKMQREFDKQQIEKEKEHRRNATRQILLFAVLLAFVAISASFFIAYKREQKRKNLVHMQKIEIEDTLSELRSTQAQLIHSEKMASLGELTAGIAHEIQNPLNFVNNFSEVNKELIEEFKSQKSKLKSEEQDEILNDIDQNLEKISFHGKRADSIVKGMLLHSRTSSGQKEPTDINALCDEYLRLAYHGLRAKDKSFNTKLETDFDNSIGSINIVSQDIGRVILNLINNAFYAVSERQRADGVGYEAAVTVATKKTGDKVLISVGDNGNGIPQNIVDKIFQPFFTTKPTGQGTGLGLSLAYDIVKAHGGEIKVRTEDGMGSEFLIVLPA